MSASQRLPARIFSPQPALDECGWDFVMASRRMRLRHELVARRENMIAAALARPHRSQVAFERMYGDTRFRKLRRHARALLDPALERRFVRLLAHREHWVGSPESWAPRVRGARGLARSLTAHLLCRFHVPLVFDEVWDTDHEGGLDWYIALAGGASLRRLSDAGLFPVPLTRRQAHLLRTEHSRQSLPMAVRRAQLRGFGSNRAIANAFADTHWGRAFVRNRGERRRSELIAWMAHQGVPAREVRRLVRFFDANHGQGQLALRRSLSRVLRECDEWEALVGPPPRLPSNAPGPSSVGSTIETLRWPASGIPAYRQQGVSIVELRSAMELMDEGRRLRHCVSSYARHCARGDRAIWSMRIDGDAVYTIEVRLPHGDIVQMRGAGNCEPGPAAIDLTRSWAKQVGLGWHEGFNRRLAYPLA